MICSTCGNTHTREDQRYCGSCHAAYMREWRKTHPLTVVQRWKDNARSHAGIAKRRGQLVQEPCAHCLSSGTEMHHADYNRPLDVVWLCRPCHLAVHRRRSPQIESRETKVTMADLVRKYAA